MRRSIITAFGLSLAFAAPVGAETPQMVSNDLGYSINVAVAQTDLTDDQALHALYGRISDAATTVCRQLVFEDASDTLSVAGCRRDAVRRAVESAGIPALTRHEAAVRAGWRPSDTTEVAAR